MNNFVREAEKCMGDKNYKSAIDFYNVHLQNNPNDIKAVIRLGFCHFLNRSEDMFFQLFASAQIMIDSLEEIPKDINNLWGQYRSLVKKLVATGAIVGTVAVSACSTQSAPKNSTDAVPAKEPVKQKVEPKKDTVIKIDQLDQLHSKDATSMHRYSGGVYLPPPMPPKENSVNPDTNEKKKPVSMHRYSGGVYLKKQ